MRIIDKNYEALDVLSNDTPSGLPYYDHRLKTTLSDGLYTLEFKVHKNNNRNSYLEVGNMIETKTRRGKKLLLTITRVEDDSFTKSIFAEDATINILNGFVDAIESPRAKERLSYYVNHTLIGSNYKLNVNESETAEQLEFTSSQRRLERLRDIAKAFSVELSFETQFEPGKPPMLLVNFLNKRQESSEEFRVSSDDLLVYPERSRNIYNLATRMLVKGAKVENKTINTTNRNQSSSTSTGSDSFAEAMIRKAFEIQKLKRPYQWGGNGNPSWDCSGFMQACIEAAGQKVNHRATTYTMKAQYAPFKVIPLDSIQRGDLLMYDTGYTTPGDWNHVGLFLGQNRSELGNPNTVIHAGNPVGITQRANSMKIMGAVRVTRP